MLDKFAGLVSLALCSGLAAQTNVCTVVDAGESCAALTVTMTPQGGPGLHMLSLHATGLHPRTIGAMHWGQTPLALQIQPNNPCLLLTSYTWGHAFQTDANGEYQWQRAWPNGIPGFFYMQMGSLVVFPSGDFDVRTTSCKLVTCTVQ